MRKLVKGSLVAAVALALLVGCGSEKRWFKIDPHGHAKGGVGYLSFEVKDLLRQAVLQMGNDISRQMPVNTGTKLWLLSLAPRHDGAVKGRLGDVYRAAMVRRGVWVSAKGRAPAGLVVKPKGGLFSFAKALVSKAKGGKGQTIILVPPKADPVVEDLFLSLIRYGNPGSVGSATTESALTQAIVTRRKAQIIERDRNVMLALAVHFRAAAKHGHKVKPAALKGKLLIPDKILAYRIVSLEKEIFTADQRSSAGWPDRRVNRVRYLWVGMHFRLIDVATSRVEWTTTMFRRAEQRILPR